MTWWIAAAMLFPAIICFNFAYRFAEIFAEERCIVLTNVCLTHQTLASLIIYPRISCRVSLVMWPATHLHFYFDIGRHAAGLHGRYSRSLHLNTRLRKSEKTFWTQKKLKEILSELFWHDRGLLATTMAGGNPLQRQARSHLWQPLKKRSKVYLILETNVLN